jgi:hypothetical protein
MTAVRTPSKGSAVLPWTCQVSAAVMAFPHFIGNSPQRLLKSLDPSHAAAALLGLNTLVEPPECPVSTLGAAFGPGKNASIAAYSERLTVGALPDVMLNRTKGLFGLLALFQIWIVLVVFQAVHAGVANGTAPRMMANDFVHTHRNPNSTPSKAERPQSQ